MRSRSFKVLLTILFIIFALAVGMYVYAIAAIKTEIVSSMEQELKAEPEPEVIIHTTIFQLPMGKISRINISAKSINLDGLLAKDLNIVVNDINVGVIDSLSGELVFESIGDVSADIVVDGSAINNILPDIVDTEIQKDEIQVSVSIFGREEKINGDIIVNDDEIKFISNFGDISRFEQLNGGPLSIENSFDVMNDKIIKVRKVEENQGFLKVYASSE